MKKLDGQVKAVVPLQFVPHPVARHLPEWTQFVVVVNGYAQAGFSKLEYALNHVTKHVAKNDNLKVGFIEVKYKNLDDGKECTEIMTNIELFEFESQQRDDIQLMTYKLSDGSGYNDRIA